MKKTSIIMAILLLISGTGLAQETETKEKKENRNKSLLGYWMLNDSRPESVVYEGSYILDNQTSFIQSKKSLELVIQHRFSSVKNGISDIYGIFGTANARLGLNFTPFDWMQVGFGTSKNYMLQDFGLKVNLLQQSRDKKMPLTITYYGNLAINATNEDNFGINYKFSNRLTFFNELLLTRKFCSWFTMSFGGSFSHFNMVDSLYEHDKIALHFLGRIKFSNQSAVVISCDVPLKIDGIKEWSEFTDHPTYNFGLGYEVVTATHVFQIVAGSASPSSGNPSYFVPQYNVMLNQGEFFKNIKNIYIGFNINRIWNF